MIVYYLGIPGSGKSYSGVNTIYNNFSNNKDAKKDLKKDYNNCYTNINEFNYDLVHNVHRFDIDIFDDQISELYRMYKAKATDEDLIVKAKEFNIYRSLFVIDECHTIFDVEKKHLVWWLTYHRHLYHDIILITQNLALVNSKYKPLAEAFYKAKSSSLTLNKKYFNYMYYTDSRMTKASYVSTIKVKKRDSVFRLYKSGDVVSSKNVVLRFIIISLLLLIPLFGIGYYLKYHMQKEASENSSKFSSSSSSSSKIEVDSKGSVSLSRTDDYNDYIYMRLLCDKEFCLYNGLTFDTTLLDFAKDNFGLKVAKTHKQFKQHIVSIVVRKEFLEFLGVKNEDNSHIDINPFGSK